MLPLSLPSVHFWCCMQFCWSLTQPHWPRNQMMMRPKKFFDNQNWVFLLAWHGTNIGSSSSYSLDPGQHYLPQHLMWTSLLRPCGKMNGSITSPPIVNTPNTMMSTRCLIFMNINLSSDWHPSSLKSTYWSFQHKCQVEQLAVFKFLKEWIASWFYFPHRQYLTDSSLLHSRQNLKQIKCVLEIDNLKWLKFNHHSVCFSVCAYIYIYKCQRKSYLILKKFIYLVFQIKNLKTEICFVFIDIHPNYSEPIWNYYAEWDVKVY